MTLYTQINSNIRKTWLLMFLFLIIIIGLGWFFSQYYQSPQILYFAVGFSLFMNIISFWYSDKIILAINRAKPIEFKDNPELYRLVENLCITAGLPMPKIYIIQDPSPNAFATGRNKNHAVIAFTTGILSALDKVELEGVIAHELSHIGNRDILLMAVVAILVGFIALLSDLFIRMSFWGGNYKNRDNENNQIGGILAFVGIILVILSPIIATLIQLAVSRKREFLADSTAALLTRYPEGLASALEKISKFPRGLTYANNSTAHLFITNPFKADSKNANHVSWLAKLFMTHPPIDERIKILRAMNLG